MPLIFEEVRPKVLRRTLDLFDIRHRQFSIGRAVLALAQLTVVVFTPYSALMQTVLGQSSAPNCAGIRKASVYCLGVAGPHWIPTAVIIAVLVLVILGVAPVPVAVLHAWVAFSVATSIALPDGGDQAAAAFALLLIPLSFGDNRRWVGDRRAGQPAAWRLQLALAGSMILRIQVAALYFNSGIAKISTPDWANGTEEYYVLRDPYFGASGVLGDVLRWATQSTIITVGMTWLPIVIEISIATLILCGPRARSIALLMSVVIHGFIILTIGLWSFGLIMIGGVMIASIPTTARQAQFVIWRRHGHSGKERTAPWLPDRYARTEPLASETTRAVATADNSLRRQLRDDTKGVVVGKKEAVK